MREIPLNVSGRAGTATLVRAAQAGDLAAFDRVIELHAGRAYRTAMHLSRRPEHAEDAWGSRKIK